MAMGFFAWRSSSSMCSICACAGAASMGWSARASETSVRSTSMSSGSATTTGPGRPLQATLKARATISGRRRASSTSVAHLASGPKAAR